MAPCLRGLSTPTVSAPNLWPFSNLLETKYSSEYQRTCREYGLINTCHVYPNTIVATPAFTQLTLIIAVTAQEKHHWKTLV
jgi:hypothetical protein